MKPDAAAPPPAPAAEASEKVTAAQIKEWYGVDTLTAQEMADISNGVSKGDVIDLDESSRGEET